MNPNILCLAPIFSLRYWIYDRNFLVRWTLIRSNGTYQVSVQYTQVSWITYHYGKIINMFSRTDTVPYRTDLISFQISFRWASNKKQIHGGDFFIHKIGTRQYSTVPYWMEQKIKISILKYFTGTVLVPYHTILILISAKIFSWFAYFLELVNYVCRIYP